MHFLSTAFFASGAMAAVLGRSNDDWSCILDNRRDMAADASCGDFPALSLCFSQLESASPPALADCYSQAGCSSIEAYNLATGAAQRCSVLFREVELRRRSRGELDARVPLPTAAPDLAATTAFWDQDIFPRTAATGEDCFTTKTTKTRHCDLETADDGKVNTQTCFSREGPVSACAPGKICSMDRSGTDICMDLKNNLDVAGIIVTVIFGVAIVLGIASITYLCCKDRKEQKRLHAKAEATALVRAATKKKRDADARSQRAPLIQAHQERQRDASTGSTDPFHDRNRS